MGTENPPIGGFSMSKVSHNKGNRVFETFFDLAVLLTSY